MFDMLLTKARMSEIVFHFGGNFIFVCYFISKWWTV